MIRKFTLRSVAILFFTILPGLLPGQQLPDRFLGYDNISVLGGAPATVDYVTIHASFSGKHLLVEATIAKDWHLYSATQPEGGTLRSEFQFDMPNLKLQDIRPTSAPHVSKIPGFDVDIESHDDRVRWIVTFEQAVSADSTIRGTLEGQVCQDGEGGVCVPLKVPFEATYDPSLDLALLLEQARSIPDRFVFRQEGSDAVKTEPLPDDLKPRELTHVTGFGTALLYAFLGGIILNFMPCVLPVIGLKILSFFEQAGKSRAKAFYLNVWYSLGLLSVFLFLAGLSYGLSILFTFDLFNIIMACVVFVMALSLMDIWEISVPGALGTGKTAELSRQEGAVGAFFKGIITTLLAIPCGAPLLSPAVNWADMQIRSGNTGLVFLAYGMIGLGMASPYLVVGAFPELLRFLPKPGAWMETFKKTMGFFLLVAVLWILYFVQVERILPTVALLFALWFACWLIGRLGYTAKPKQRVLAWVWSLLVVGLVLFFSFQFKVVDNPYTLENAMKTKLYGHSGAHWQPYTPDAFDAALAAGRPVLVDFTADWCVNCKVLEQTVLHAKTVLDKLEEKNAVSLVGDCTKEGDAKAFLRRFGADQVPVLVIFDPKKPKEPVVLRGGYTQGTLLELLDRL